MLFNVFKKSSSGKKKPSLENVLLDLTSKSPTSANCTLIKNSAGEESDDDLGAATIFLYGEETLVRDKSFFITTPDGVKAEETSLLVGKGELIHLWFLHNRIPHALDCRVLGRLKFPPEVLDELHPRVPMGYALRPVGPIRKNDKRQFLRYTHKVGHGAGMKVYSQILFDLYVQKTDVTFPETGSLPNQISDLHLIPHAAATDLDGQEPEEVVKFMKNALRLNPRDSRVVFVGKPFMDERTNKVSLVELGQSDVLGLETSKEESRTFYIRKPLKMSSDKKDPRSLSEGETIVLGFHTRVTTDTPTEYYDLIAEVTRVGTENLTVRTAGKIRKETGIPAEMLDFSVGGIKFHNTNEFLEYVLGEDHQEMPLEDKTDTLESLCYQLNFYPKLRFNRETESYEPDVPMRIQILAKIVRTELSRPKEDGESPDILGFGLKFYYDPEGYSRDAFSYDRWQLIRDFKENNHFREIHNSLNGLIAFLESQSR